MQILFSTDYRLLPTYVLLQILCCCGVVLLQILSRCRLGFAVEAVLLQILFSRSLGFLPVISCFADASSLQILCCCRFCVVADSVSTDCRLFPGYLLLQSVSLRVDVVANYVLLQMLCCSRVVVVVKYVSLQIRCCWRCCLLAHSPNGRFLMATVLWHIVHLQILRMAGL